MELNRDVLGIRPIPIATMRLQVTDFFYILQTFLMKSWVVHHLFATLSAIGHEMCHNVL